MIRWFGHVERISDERLAKKFFEGKVSGRRGRGRPRWIFKDTVSKIVEEGDIKRTRTSWMACVKETKLFLTFLGPECKEMKMV